MSRERFKRSIIALGIGVGLGFAADKAAGMSDSDYAVRRETPAAILPDKIVLIAPEKRLKK
jgi:hypothetical protein